MAVTTQVDARTLIGYLIATNGNSSLAAVRASKDLGEEVTEPQLLATIAADPTSLSVLSHQIKLLMLLKALDAFRQTHLAFLERLPMLSPRDTASTYIKLMEAVSLLGQPVISNGTDSSTAGAFDAVMRTLPPQVADAVEFFIKNPDQAASSHDDSTKARGDLAGCEADIGTDLTDYGDVPPQDEDRSTSYGGYALHPPVKMRSR